jgi:hypothetical protein
VLDMYGWKRQDPKRTKRRTDADIMTGKRCKISHHEMFALLHNEMCAQITHQIS